MVESILQKNSRMLNVNMNLFCNPVDSLQNIEMLWIDVKPITKFVKNVDNFICMKSLKVFSISFNTFFEVPVCFLPFSFENLKAFVEEFPKQEIRNSFVEEFFYFIEGHSTITHLSIRKIENTDDVDWSKLAKSLPLLNYL